MRRPSRPAAVSTSVAIFALPLVLVLTACTSGSSQAAPTPPPDTDLTVVAKGYAYDPDQLVATSDQTTTIFFTNEDGEQHDIAIYANKDSKDALFEGELIGRTSTVYEVPALAAGTYYFTCTLHPVMFGDLTVDP